MSVCACPCGCQNEFEEMSEQSLALLIALSERKIPYDKAICNGCRYDKHKKRKMKAEAITIEA